ncbi:MAG: hypothetical protein JXD18_08705 [Anaerolineae bacterium]|nr:hypothetical protein [Anaerolineae bacterium]
MDKKRAVEALNGHASQLNGQPGASVRLASDEVLQLRPLMDLAEHLKLAMVPVEPPTAFVRNLGHELLEASRYQQTAARRMRRGMVIGAAAVGSALSVAGVVTLIVLRRRGHARPAS